MRIFPAFISILAALALIAGGARADENTPLLYTRTDITLLRHHGQPMPWQTGGDIAPLIFDVEVRDATTLYQQEGWFNLSNPSPNSAVLLVFSAPSISPVIRSQQYKPLDVLFVDKQGKITQIMPNVMLSELEQEVYPAGPVLAFLFLKGGTCAEQSINPGDELEYKIFKKPPVVLSEPVAQPAAPTPTPAPAATPAPAPEPSFRTAPPKSKIQSK